jgi:hypothetical protein
MAVMQTDREDWYFHPVTREFVDRLRQSIQETMEAWAAEQYVASDSDKTLQFNAKALGGVDALRKTLELIDDCKPQDPAIGENDA